MEPDEATTEQQEPPYYEVTTRLTDGRKNRMICKTMDEAVALSRPQNNPITPLYRGAPIVVSKGGDDGLYLALAKQLVTLAESEQLHEMTIRESDYAVHIYRR